MERDDNPILKHLLLTAAAVVVVVAACTALAYGVFGNPQHRAYLGVMMVAIAVIVFFGLLSLPQTSDGGATITEARIRLAIAGTLLLEYLAYFGFVVFLERNKNEVGFAETVFPTLTGMIQIVLPFYFGASAAVQIAGARSKETPQEPKAQETPQEPKAQAK